MSNNPTNDPGNVPQNPYSTPAQNPYGSAPQDPYAAAPQDPYAQQAGYGQPAPQAGYGQPGYGVAQPGYQAPQLANWFKRVAANIIDSIPGAILGGIAGNFMPQTDPNSGAQLSEGNWPVAMVFLALAFGWTLWNRWLRAGRTGQSIGKSALGIKLLDEMTGQPIGAGKAFLRDVCHVLDSICYIGYLWPLWDAKRQTFADKIVKTVVVDAK